MIETNEDQEQPFEAKRVVMIEMEMTLWPGVKRTFDVLKGVLAKRQVKLDEVGFARFCLGKPLRRALMSAITDAEKDGDIDEMLEEAREQLPAALSNTDDLTDLSRLVTFVQDDEPELALISCTEDEQQSDLLAAAGVDLDQTILSSTAVDHVCATSSDAWKRALRDAVASPRLSVAIVSTPRSLRSALATGVRVAVVTNDLTRFADYSGADLVVDTLNSQAFEDLQELIGRC